MSKLTDAERATLDVGLRRVPSQDELAQMLGEARVHGLLLEKTAWALEPGISGSWLGGEPTLPADIEWPWYGSEDDPLVPLHFVAQLDLGQIPRHRSFPDFPRSGTLFFFYDPAIAPTLGMAEGGSKVIYVDADVSACPERLMPDIPHIHEDSYTSSYRDNATIGYHRWNFVLKDYSFINMEFYPNYTFSAAAAAENYKEDQADKQAFKIKYGAYKNGPERHVIHSLFIGESQHSGSASQPLADTDLIPLLMISSDRDCEFDNAGHPIIFRIPRCDLASGQFENVVVHGV